MLSSLCLWALLFSPVAGQGENSTQKGKAQILLQAGSALYDQGAYAGALEKFSAAYAAYPSPKLLFNIGQANVFLDRPVEAHAAFEQFLAKATDAPSDLREEAEQNLAQLRLKLSRLIIHCTSLGAEITVDGKPAGKVPLSLPIWVIPGRHQITARHATFIPLIEDIATHAGEVRSIQLVLRSATWVPTPSRANTIQRHSSATSMVEAGVADSPLERSTRANYQWTWVAGSSTVLFAGAGTYFGLSMRSKYEALEKSCGARSSTGAGCSEREIASLNQQKSIANAFWGLSVAALAATTVLYFVEGNSVAVAPLVGSTTRGMVASIHY